MKIPLEVKALGGALITALLSLGCITLSAGFIQKTSSARDTSTPTASASLTSPLAVQGQQSYEMSCSDCHGDDAHGDEGPDLHNLAISNARITKVIKGGIKGQMPGYAKKYDAAQIAALVSYLRTLR